MSDESVEDETSVITYLLNPSRLVSQWLFGFGLWFTLLAILNVGWGLVSPGERKVIWANLLTFGTVWPETYAPFVGAVESFRLMSDGVFFVISLTLLLLGIKGLQNTVEGGVIGWLKSILKSDMWGDLFAPNNKDWNATIGGWALVIGFGFYIVWNILYWKWVDVGVYAIAAPLVAFGFALRFASATESTGE